LGLALVGTSVVAGAWYYLTPKYANIGYQPRQPVNFSHAVHVDQLGMDCRYCHDHVEKSWFSNVPAASTCMKCHNQVLAEDPRLELVRTSAETGQPIPWVQIHKMPDFAYFNHSVHVNRGVSCIHCHGEVHKMEEVRQVKELSMAFCLECHRHPDRYVRPPDQVFNLNWKTNEAAQLEMGAAFVHDWKIMTQQGCSTCHR
jgi:hypothetical protein